MRSSCWKSFFRLSAGRYAGYDGWGLSWYLVGWNRVGVYMTLYKGIIRSLEEMFLGIFWVHNEGGGVLSVK